LDAHVGSREAGVCTKIERGGRTPDAVGLQSRLLLIDPVQSARLVELLRVESSTIEESLNLEILVGDVRIERREGCSIEIWPIGSSHGGQVIGAVFNLLPAQHLRIKPKRVTYPRECRVMPDWTIKVFHQNRFGVGCQREVSTQTLAQ